MYAELVAHQFGVLLKSDCLVGVVRHDILEHVLLSQNVTFLTVALQPESGRLVIKVVGYGEVIHSDPLDILIDLFLISQVVLFYVLSLGEYIVCLWGSLVLLLLHLGHHLFHVLYFFVVFFAGLWLSPNLRDHLGVHFNHLLVLTSLWVDCLGPAIFKVNLLDALGCVFDV